MKEADSQFESASFFKYVFNIFYTFSVITPFPFKVILQNQFSQIGIDIKL